MCICSEQQGKPRRLPRTPLSPQRFRNPAPYLRTCPAASHTIVATRITFRPFPRMNSTEERTAESGVKTLERDSDDRPLIEAAQGEPARFAELYEQNFVRVYAFFARRVG